MTNESSFAAYRSAKGLSRIVVILFGIQLGCYACYFVLSLLRIAGIDTVLESAPEMPLSYMLIGLISLLESLARLATIVMFLVWIHRVYTNFPALRVSHLEFTPGWVVGWWFIPFANLVKPYQAVSEGWRESDPDYDDQFGYLSAASGNPWQFPVWWVTFLLKNIASRISDVVFQDPQAGELFPYVLIAAVTLAGISAALAIWIVRDTTSRQDLRASRVVDFSDTQQPPPPPTFGSTE